MKRFIYVSALALSLFCSCETGVEEWNPTGPQTPPPSQEVVDYAARGYEVFELVQEYYKTGNLYRENFPVQSGSQKPAKRVSASTNPEDAENVLDEKINTAWQGNKGDYITFALKNGAKVDKVAIAFTRDNNLPATFEIQLSGGGGQFLTVYSGTVSEYGKLISYPFKGTTASDLRIVLNDDRVGVAEVKF